MKFVRTLTQIFAMLAVLTVPALAQTTIVSPTNGQGVSSPFTLNMWADSCSSLPVTGVGYSLDDSTQTSAWNDWYINGPVTAPSGWHTLHVKVWNNQGGICVTDVSINVGGSSGGGGGMAVVPSNAAAIGGIQTMGDWEAIHDEGTPGSSSGSMSMTGSPSLTGSARLFANQFNYYGGERYAAQISNDVWAQNFLYDTWVYIASDSNGFSNLEFDLNQTMPNGETVIMGFQCDTWNNTWDYTVNGGSPDQPWDTWLHSYASCNVHNWAPNQWHHVQIYFSHDQNGWVTYHSVWLDGAEQDLNVNVFSGFSLGWGPAITTQFQIDGNSSGTTWGNVYLDQMTVYRW
ncbi:MAG TPA: hypothetical protein VFB43_22180 [Terracidiphilus sp.]|jgi:hypothetical protein|nr:hypothetical protein [Terracidiphilus sp.]